MSLIGRVYKFKEDHPSKGNKGDYMVVLSMDREAYKIGIFWWSGQNIDDFGGAREYEFYEYEIEEWFEYVGHINQLAKGE